MRKNTFLMRLKIAWNFLRFGKGNVRIMTCGKCDGQLIRSITDEPFDSTDYKQEGYQIDRCWIDFNRCLKCGAVCKEIQFWNFDGDPTKLDDQVEPKDDNEERA